MNGITRRLLITVATFGVVSWLAWKVVDGAVVQRVYLKLALSGIYGWHELGVGPVPAEYALQIQAWSVAAIVVLAGTVMYFLFVTQWKPKKVIFLSGLALVVGFVAAMEPLRQVAKHREFQSRLKSAKERVLQAAPEISPDLKHSRLIKPTFAHRVDPMLLGSSAEFFRSFVVGWICAWALVCLIQFMNSKKSDNRLEKATP